MAGSNMAMSSLTLRRDEKVALPYKINPDIGPVINRALIHVQAPAHIGIMNTKRNAKVIFTTIPHQHTTAEMALAYNDIIE
jgi:hypothetical protein